MAREGREAVSNREEGEEAALLKIDDRVRSSIYYRVEASRAVDKRSRGGGPGERGRGSVVWRVFCPVLMTDSSWVAIWISRSVIERDGFTAMRLGLEYYKMTSTSDVSRPVVRARDVCSWPRTGVINGLADCEEHSTEMIVDVMDSRDEARSPYPQTSLC